MKEVKREKSSVVNREKGGKRRKRRKGIRKKKMTEDRNGRGNIEKKRANTMKGRKEIDMNKSHCFR